MILIAHRGNLNGPNPQEENKPEYIQKAIGAGYDVEVDVWMNNDRRLFLGHDNPKYEVSYDQLLMWRNHAWFHAKNLNILNEMIHIGGFNVFWHETDKFALTSEGFIWTYPGQDVTPNSVIVQLGRPNRFLKGKVRGICTDYAAEHEG